MKILISRRIKRLSVIFVLLFLIGAIAGSITDARYLGVFSSNRDTDKYKVRNELLMESINEIGSCKPESTVQTWGTGLMKRSAAMQYSVMTKELKDKYARELEKNFPNWVTGVSSPQVSNFKITKTERLNDAAYKYTLRFATKTSTGPSGEYSATVTVSKEGDYWRISKIQTDKGLNVYTGWSE